MSINVRIVAGHLKDSKTWRINPWSNVQSVTVRFSVWSTAEGASFSKVPVLMQRRMVAVPCPLVAENGLAAVAIHPVTRGRASLEWNNPCDNKSRWDNTDISISMNYASIRREIPDDVIVIVSCKTRTAEAIKEVIAAGATDIGENYVQEAGQIYSALGKDAAKVRWRMIGRRFCGRIIFWKQWGQLK